jgi:chorismate mutase
MTDFVEDNTLEMDTVIYSDYQIVKFQIWTSWFNFIPRFTSLVIYSMQDVDIQDSLKYREAINFMVQTYLNITQQRYEEYLKKTDDEKDLIKKLKELFKKIISEQYTPNIKDMYLFEEATSIFLNNSGMANLSNEKRDPSRAMRW